MKSFRYEKLALISRIERKALEVNFNGDVTYITGENDTGKSFFVKSIYWALGADVYFHKTWRAAAVISIATFVLDDVRYALLRADKQFLLFDENEELVWSAYGISRELASKFADLFDFHLKLLERSSASYKQATPGFAFLPYYFDQDRGWTQSFNSFQGLGQFAKWQDELIKYLSGKFPEQYYVLRDQLEVLLRDRESCEAQLDVLIHAMDDLSSERADLVIDLDVSNFEAVIGGLRDELRELSAAEETFRKKSLDQANERHRLIHQLQIISASISELKGDLVHAESLPEHLECPTCGQEYENDFVARFGIVDDLAEAERIKDDLQVQLDRNSETLVAIRDELARFSEKQHRLRGLLNREVEGVTLDQVIASESDKKIRGTIETRIVDRKEDAARLAVEIERMRADLESFKDKERSREINVFFKELMEKHIAKLSLQNVSSDDFKSMKMRVKEVGSDTPRALLAYGFAVLRVMQRYGYVCSFPIVLDSLNQQEQDESNLRKIIEFCRDERPKECQLVLASVDFLGLNPPEKTISFNRKWSVLGESNFDGLSARYMKHLNAYDEVVESRDVGI